MSSPFPEWLEFSGLPQLLKGGAGWSLFHKLAQLDCTRNTAPGEIEIPVAELATRTGLDVTTATRALNRINKLGLVKMYLADDAEEASLFKIADPLPHVDAARIRLDHPKFAGARLRYLDPPDSPGNSPREASMAARQEVADLYTNCCGFRYNQFILDRLDAMASRYQPDQIRRAFACAVKNNTRSLSTVERELAKWNRTSKENPDAI